MTLEHATPLCHWHTTSCMPHDRIPLEPHWLRTSGPLLPLMLLTHYWGTTSPEASGTPLALMPKEYPWNATGVWPIIGLWEPLAICLGGGALLALIPLKQAWGTTHADAASIPLGHWGWWHWQIKCSDVTGTPLAPHLWVITGSNAASTLLMH
jgi:hypothetical protein